MTPPKITEKEESLAILKEIRSTLKEVALEQIRHHEWQQSQPNNNGSDKLPRK
jgi:hypothetical protein